MLMETETTTKKPTALMDVLAYREAWHRLQELRGQLTEAKNELYSKKPPTGGSFDEAVAATVKSGVVTLPLAAAEDNKEYRGRLRTVEVLGGAVEVQEKLVRQAEVTASHEICKAHEGEFFEIAAEMGEMLKTVQSILRKEYDFRHALVDGGVALKAPIRPIGLKGDAGGEPGLTWQINHWFEENGDLL